jgi:hypothetical protein
MYDEKWVERLYQGWRRNTSRDFKFVLYVDALRNLGDWCEQKRLDAARPTYLDCVQPYELTADEPMILTGLDTVITGNVDHLIDYAQTGACLALPRDPYSPHVACNGVALIPAGHAWVWTEWKPNSRQNDMDRCRSVEHVFMDDLWPGHVVSYKGSVQRSRNGLGDARVVYFHGDFKPHQLTNLPWIRNHWFGVGAC